MPTTPDSPKPKEKTPYDGILLYVFFNGKIAVLDYTARAFPTAPNSARNFG